MHTHIIFHLLRRNSLEFEICYNFSLRKATRLLTQFYESRLADFGLKVGQFSILRAVSLLKETTNKELQKRLVINQTTLTRNLKPLIRDGLLSLSTDIDDQRIKLIRLTESGNELYKRALPSWIETQREVAKKIGSEDVDKILTLTKSLEKSFNN